MSALEKLSFGHRLRLERQHQNWTQEELAQRLKATKLSIIRWESGQAQPRSALQREIYELFGKTEKTFGLFLPHAWNVPFERNPYFSEREDIITSLHDSFTKSNYTALTQQALSGLGGIGKTQIAIEYAYRYAQEYDAILWVRADSYKLLTSDLASLADLLGLGVQKDQPWAIQVVKTWLQTHIGWLLIFDNVEDIEMLSEFVPKPLLGAVLLTTRVQVRKRSIHKLDVITLSHEQSLRFLLRRAGLIEPKGELTTLPQQELQAAETLCEHLAGLPLALDQAAAYIDEYQCSVADYLSRFLVYRRELLGRRDPFSQDYPYSVATTWEISFERVRAISQASADLLSLCAFLHPDAIPIEIMTRASAHLSTHIQSELLSHAGVDAIIKPLFSFSLVNRDREAATLSLHRLVQAVIRDHLDQETYSQWAELTVRVLDATFPEGEFSSWSDCERYLPHALVCVELIRRLKIASSEAVDLLKQTGCYLKERTRYIEALPILNTALTLCEQLFGPQHVHTSTALYHLADDYACLYHLTTAEPLYERALAIQKQQLGMNHPVTAQTLEGLADLHHPHEQSETLRLEALHIREQVLGKDHPETLKTRNMLAGLYFHQDRYEEAEAIWRPLLTLRQQTLGMEHPETARVLNNLGILAMTRGNYEEAEALCLQALPIIEQHLGPEHRFTATSLNNLAEICADQGRFAEAEAYWLRALAIRRKHLGPEHPDTRKIQQFLDNLPHNNGL